MMGIEFHWYYLLYALVAYVGIYTVLAWIAPSLLHPVWWMVTRSLYHFRVYGRERVPMTGPMLLVANHVSYIDWLILWAACPRKLTFVLWVGYRQYPILRFFLSFVHGRTIYIDNKTTHPHAMNEALNKVANALAGGRAILIFPEGRLTRNGQLRPFHRGIEWVVKRAGVPVTIVPACIWNMWGSLLSLKYRFRIWRWPEEFRRKVAVCFGKPIPGETPLADIRAALVEATAECAIFQSDYALPVHAGFVRKAAKITNLFRVGFVDASSGTDRTLTWPKALVGAWCLAKWLKRELKPEEKTVGIWLPTGLGAAFANIALAFLRRTTVNLNYTAGSEPVKAAAKSSGIKTIITSKRFVDRVPLDLPDAYKRIYLEEVIAQIPGRWKLVRFMAILLLPGWVLDRFVLRCRRFHLDDLLTIIFSSGSTGEPKGVMLSLRNISCNTDGFQKGVNFTEQDRMLCTLPMFHSFGYTVCLWAPAAIGMMAVYYPDPRAAKDVGELSKRWKCSIVLGTATFVNFYLRRCQPDDFKAARLFICGAEKLPVTLAQQFQEKFGVLPLEGYGCTELSPVVGTNLPDLVTTHVRQRANIFGTIGQPVPGVVAKAYHPETREPLPTGEEGVLCVKGPNVMVGYLNQPERTANVLLDGWYWTGDVGLIEPDGFIRITGRLSRFAKIAGEMVPLEKLEEELHQCLQTDGTRAVAILAVPDIKRGERLILLYLPNVADTIRPALESLRTKGISNLWIPDFRDAYQVEAFPVLGTGKLDLRAVQELAIRLTRVAA